MPQITCGKCYPCRHGDYNICNTLKVIGCQADGAAQEFFAADEKLLMKLPKGMDYDAGAMIEPAAVGIHALRRLWYGVTWDIVFLLGTFLNAKGILLAKERLFPHTLYKVLTFYNFQFTFLSFYSDLNSF